VRVESDSPAETEAAGARLAERLTAGDVVLVVGELGTGKTTFVRGAARALGVRGRVTSPTYTIGQVYDGPLPVAHLDLYRIGEPAATDRALLDDYLTPDRVAFIEWPQSLGSELESVVARVELLHLGGDRRLITIE
jgi:tRNA threonylcarbamoyladenosine biosynthesis protein TsaE